MLGILYIILSFYIGFSAGMWAFPRLFCVSGWKSLAGNQARLPNWMVICPGSYLLGTLIMTWVTYLFSYFFRFASQPLRYGNIMTFILFIACAVSLHIFGKRQRPAAINEIQGINIQKIRAFLKNNLIECIFLFMSLILSVFLMFYTFSVRNNTIYIGFSVWGDFGPHLGVIRSFSWGSNFPTEYPHFADGNIRYHFMFQFLAANLEYLGLRIDWAFNIPSILSMVAFLLLLYSFAVILAGNRWVGILTGILFLFRSSFAFFTFMSDMKSLREAVSRILSNEVYIGRTMNENWGLWTQNVYINQRHLPFGLAVFLLVLIVMFPLYEQMIHALKTVKERSGEDGCLEKSPASGRKCIAFYLKNWIREFIFAEDNWIPLNIRRSLAAGALLGLVSFWNGAVVFGALPILFFMAIPSKHRLEYLNVAVLTAILSFIQSAFFMGNGAKPVNPRLVIGFLAAQKDFIGILKYYIELLGIFPFVLIAAAFLVPGGMRWLMLAFITPMVMATTISLTPDINANHKFVIMSVILLNIAAAYFLYVMFSSRKSLLLISAAVLSAVMTVTGIVDFITLCNLNKSNRRVAISINDPITKWVRENTGPNEVFLTDVHVIHPILLAGRKFFYGWPYYAWSAGYDTYGREAVVKQIYGGTDIARIKELVRQNNISYIVIESGNRNAKAYELNEELFRKNFKLVYENGQRDIAIFRTY